MGQILGDSLPYALRDNSTGAVVWTTLYSFLLLLPLSLPRDLSAL